MKFKLIKLLCLLLLIEFCLLNEPIKFNLKKTKPISIEPENNKLEFSFKRLFKYTQTKSFICLSLFYFQSSALLVFNTIFIFKTFLTLLTIFYSFKINDVIPYEVFQVTAIGSYILLSLNILWNLVYNEANLYKKPKKRNEETKSHLLSSLKNLTMNDIETIVKIVGLIIVTQAIDGDFFVEGSFLVKDLKNTLYNVGLEVFAVFISASSGIAFAFLLSITLNINCNLLISSITFLLSGIDTLLKFYTI
jgi:hypothetical protein